MTLELNSEITPPILAEAPSPSKGTPANKEQILQIKVAHNSFNPFLPEADTLPFIWASA